MPERIQRTTPCLWFDDCAEEAASFYTGIFDDGEILTVSRYGREIAAAAGRPEGSVLTVSFRLDGQAFLALNGGPVCRFNEAISFVVNCETQAEVDHFWDRLGEDGDESAQRCGWLKDKYGVSWQVVPTVLPELMADPDPARAGRVATAMLGMKKLDIQALKRAYDGTDVS